MSVQYVVKQGDCLSSIAKQFGFPDWRRIYDDPQNAAFKKKRPNPNLIFPGDVLAIPDRQAKQETRPTTARHTFRAKRSKARVRIKVKDQDDKAFAGKKYRLVVGGRTFEGNIGQDGLIEHPIEPDAGAGALTVWLDGDTSRPGIVWNLKVGHLDPVEENTGIQARLKNLGFDCGVIDGIVGPKTRAAILGFQIKNGLQPTGQIDGATRGKLKALHDEG